MSKTRWSMLAGLFLSSCVLAQTNQAAMAATPHTVKQGEQVLIHVKVNPSPSVGGRLDVFIAPEGSKTLNVNGGTGLAPGQTGAVDIGIPIPIDGKVGNWKVIVVRFQPQNSPPNELTLSGNITFEVEKREIVLPTSADVQVK